MSEERARVALALEPETEVFGFVPLMEALVDLRCFETLREARDFVVDLEAVAPQVVWVKSGLREQLQVELAGMDIGSRVVSDEEAERIAVENKPVWGSIDLQIRTRNDDVDSEMIKELKSRKLISGYRRGDNAEGIFHWKDDRWFQDFHLAVFNEEDIPVIEELIGERGYVIVGPDTEPGN